MHWRKKAIANTKESKENFQIQICSFHLPFTSQEQRILSNPQMRCRGICNLLFVIQSLSCIGICDLWFFHHHYWGHLWFHLHHYWGHLWFSADYRGHLWSSTATWSENIFVICYLIYAFIALLFKLPTTATKKEVFLCLWWSPAIQTP